MKRTIFFLSIFSFLFISNNSFAQGEAAVPFLIFPISPVTTGMGATGTSLPSDDTYGFLQNPAQLGYVSKKTNFSVSFYPGNSEIWGFDTWRFNCFASNIGFNFKERFDVPISVGLGFARTAYTLEDHISSFNFKSFKGKLSNKLVALPYSLQKEKIL